MRSRLNRSVAVVLVIATMWVLPRAVSAGPAVLKRSFENITQTPFEVGILPWVAAYTIKRNMEIDRYTNAQKWVVGPPGFGWVLLVQAGMATGRFTAGVLEFPIGLVTLFMNREPAPLVDLEHTPALVDKSNDFYHLKFGMLMAARDVEGPPADERDER
jgi:hypothetical protein